MLLVSAMNNERKLTIPSEYAGVFSVAAGPGTDREQVWCELTVWQARTVLAAVATNAG